MNQSHKILALLFLSGVIFLAFLPAGQIQAQQIDPATGGASISADNFNSGTFTTLTGPVLTETSAGQISTGFIEFTAPSGYEWDTGGTNPTVTITLAPGQNGSTQLDIVFSSRTASKLIFEVVASSDTGPRRPGQATFSGFRVRPTKGTLPNTGNITNSGNSAPAGNTNYGTLTMVAGAASKIRVETASDGSGQAVSAQNVTAGNSLTVFAISRDQNNNFVASVSADSWSMVNTTGGVDTQELSPLSGSSTTFSSDTTGSGQIRATKSGLTSVDSGIITVQPDQPNSLLINTQPSSTATAGQTFAQQPVIHVLDVFGNIVTTNNSLQITASRSAGSGTLQGTKTITVQQGVATYTNLKHNVANTISISFNTTGLNSITSNTIDISPAAASKLVFAVQPPNGAKNNALTPAPEVQISDNFGNAIAQSGTSITVSQASGPAGSISNSSTTTEITNASGTAIFDDLKFTTEGTYTIQAQSTGLTSVTSNSFKILSAGELANFLVEISGGGNIGPQTAGQTFIIQITALDGTGSVLNGTGQTAEYTGKAFIASSGNNGFGLGDSTIVFSAGSVTDTVALNVSGDFAITASAVNSSGNGISNNSNTFTVNPAAASADSTQITAEPASIVANGTSTSLITVQAKDAFGNNLVAGGDNVTISTTGGTLLGSLTDNGDGTYTQSLQSSTTAQTASITGSINSTAINDNATVNFVAGGLNHFAVETAGGGTIGTQTAGTAFNIRITAQDEFNNTVTTFNGSINITSNRTINSGGGSVSLSSGVVDNHSITITQAGQNNVTLTATNTTGTQDGTSNTFTVNPGAFDITNTTITPANRFIENTGTDNTLVTVQTKDQFGNNLLSGGQPVELNTSAGTISSTAGGSVGTGTFITADDQSNGTYTATVTSSTNVATANISGRVNSTVIPDTAQVTFAEFNTWLSSGGGGDNPITWERDANWTLGTPTSSQAVIIPSNPVNAQKFPIIKSNPTVSFVQIESGATIVVDPTFSITITNEVVGDGALIIDNGTATISGNISVSNFSAGNSTVILNGTTEQQIPGTMVTDILNIQNSSPTGIVTSNYVNADTRLTVTDSKLTMQTGSTFEVFGDVTGNGRINSSNATFLIGGNVSLDTVDVSTSDVTFNGTAAQTISTITTYDNLTVNNTSGVTLDTTSTVNGTLEMLSGSVLQANQNLVGNTLTAGGSTLKLNGDLSFTSVSTPPNTVEFIGSVDQELLNFGSFNNLTVNKTAGSVNTQSNVQVTGTLTLSSGDLVMGSGTNLLAPNRSQSGGQLRFRRILTSKGWYALSAPLSSTYGDLLDAITTQGYQGATYNPSAPNDTLQPNVMYYEESYPGTDNQRWRAVEGADSAIVEGRGQFVYLFGNVSGDSRYNNPAPDTLEVSGNEFTGNGTEVDFGVTFTASADSGWNLVGNPYGATLDWDDSGNWTKTNMDNTIYVWDHTANGGNGEYLVWNGFTGNLGDGLIAPFQAFWVKANAASPVLKVSENAKTAGGVFYKRKANSKVRKHPVVGLKLSAQNLETSAFISFSENANLEKDPRDGYRLLPFTDTYLQLFTTLDDGTRLTINNMPRKFGKTIEIPLFTGGFVKGKELAGSYTLSWPSLNNIPAEWSMVLVDRETNTEINLEKESFYTFDLKAQGKTNHSNGKVTNKYSVAAKADAKDARFILKINPGGDAGDLPGRISLDQNYPNPFNPSTTIRFGLPIQSRVRITIYDILGRKVAILADKRYDAGFHTVSWNPDALASGVYLYYFNTGEKSFTKKMTFIK